MRITFAALCCVCALAMGCGSKDGEKQGEASTKKRSDFPDPKTLCDDAVSAIAVEETPDGVGPGGMEALKAARDKCREALEGAPSDQTYVGLAECVSGAESMAALQGCFTS